MLFELMQKTMVLTWNQHARTHATRTRHFILILCGAVNPNPRSFQPQRVMVKITLIFNEEKITFSEMKNSINSNQ